MKKFLTTFLILLIFGLINAQDDPNLAFSYYNAKEYSKAEQLFKSLYEKQKVFFYFEYYIRCLVLQKEYKEATKEIEKQQKKEPDNLKLLVLQIYTYTAWGKIAEADNVYKQLYAQLPNNDMIIRDIGVALINIQEYNKAEEVYKKGETFAKGKFLENLANLYDIKRDYENMINSYLQLASIDLSKRDYIKTIFLNRMQQEIDNEFSNLLEKSLIINIQKNKDIVYEDFLVWFYTEKYRYKDAIFYAEALDKRFNTPIRIYNIGVKAYENRDFLISSQCFRKVIDYGTMSPYYYNAQAYLLQSFYWLIVENQISDTNQVINIEKNYRDYLQSSNPKFEVYYNFIELLAFYLNKPQEALDEIKTAITKTVMTENRAKLIKLRGDIELFSGNIWEAILSYANVETNFVNFQIADDAKFAKAKAYYFLHKMQWAKDQFDILKGNTSKHTANDAIYMSFFIDYNTSWDSNYTTLKLFANAEYSIFKRKFIEAHKSIDTILTNFSNDVIVSYALFLKADCYSQQKNYSKAAETLENLINKYPNDPITDKAVYTLAKIYYENLKNNTKAAETYRLLYMNYPSSVFSNEATQKYLEITQGKVN